jgi:hypothetical protein
MWCIKFVDCQRLLRHSGPNLVDNTAIAPLYANGGSEYAVFRKDPSLTQPIQKICRFAGITAAETVS